MMRRALSSRTRLTAAVVTAGLMLSACASDDSLVDDVYSQRIDEMTTDYPLPAGASYDSASSRPADLAEEAANLASLAPTNTPPKEAIPEIYKRGRIIVGVDQSLNLLGFRDSATGELAGFEVSLAQEIAKDIFGDPNAIEFRFVGSNERVRALQNGDVDLVLRTLSVTKSRQREISFSTPYLNSQVGVLVASPGGQVDESVYTSGRICVSRNSTPESLMRRSLPKSTLLLVSNWSDCLVALQNGQAEVVVADDTILAGINDQDPETAIIKRGLSDENYGVGVAKNNPNLVRLVNATLERVAADGTWQSLYDIWFGPFLPGGVQPAPEYLPEGPGEAGESGGPEDSGDSGEEVNAQ